MSGLGGLHLAVDGSGLARPLAGVGTYTREILAAMAAQRPGCRLTVYVPPGVAFQSPRAATRPLPATRLLGRHFVWPARLRRLGAHAYFGPAGALPLREVGMPAVVTAHDLAIYRHPEWFPKGQWLSVRWVVPHSLRRADAVVAVSRSTARDVAELFDVEPQRLAVVHEGVSSVFRRLGPLPLARARERWALPERFILFVGTIEPRKNLPTLLEAWARMDRRPGLVIAGSWGWRHQEVRLRLARLGAQVRLLGPVEPADLACLYNLATCLAHPAWYEGFGLTPLEAMACGTPVVCSNATSLPEVVGEAGLLVDPADVEGWTQALERICSDHELRAELRRRGLLRAAELGWDRAAQATWRVLEQVVGSGS